MGCLTYNCTFPLAARNMVALARQRSLGNPPLNHCSEK